MKTPKPLIGYVWCDKDGGYILETFCSLKRDAESDDLFHKEDGDYLVKVLITPLKKRKKK